mgnify:CR=1 FL=1
MRKIKRFLSALLCGAILITGTLAGVSVRTDAAASSYAVQLRAAGFPDSYISALSALHTAYPQWQFQAVKTGLDWNTVVSLVMFFTRVSRIHWAFCSTKRSACSRLAVKGMLTITVPLLRTRRCSCFTFLRTSSY